MPSSLWPQGSCSVEFLAGFDPKVPLDPHQGPSPRQAPEQEELGEGQAQAQSWEVVAGVAAVGVAQEAPQFQGVEEVVVQNVHWLEGVVAEGPLGLGVEVPGGLVGVGHPPKVQEAVDQIDPWYPPP